MATQTVLGLLDDRRILNVEVVDSGLTFCESCDYYFEVTLTPTQVRQLCRELEALADAIEAQHTAATPPDTAPK